MNFRLVKASIINILGAAEAGRYRTIGFQRQGTAASEIVGALRTVQVYYDSGQFPETAGRVTGSLIHVATFNIDLKVSENAKGDISVLNNVGSTPEARAAALSLFQEASPLADDSFDELVEIVFQVLSDARNYDLGMPKGIVSNRWIANTQKNEPLPEGEHVTLTGSMPITCRIIEDITGETPTPADTFDNTLIVDDDTATKTGKTVINT